MGNLKLHQCNHKLQKTMGKLWKSTTIANNERPSHFSKPIQTPKPLYEDLKSTVNALAIEIKEAETRKKLS